MFGSDAARLVRTAYVGSTRRSTIGDCSPEVSDSILGHTKPREEIESTS